jgi:hypothetical protein
MNRQNLIRNRTPIAPSRCSTVSSLEFVATVVQCTRGDARMRKLRRNHLARPFGFSSIATDAICVRRLLLRQLGPVSPRRVRYDDFRPVAPAVTGRCGPLTPLQIVGTLRPEAADAVEDTTRNEHVRSDPETQFLDVPSDVESENALESLDRSTCRFQPVF